MSKTAPKWTQIEDEQLFQIVSIYLFSKKPLSKAFIEASRKLGRTEKSCETRWHKKVKKQLTNHSNTQEIIVSSLEKFFTVMAPVSFGDMVKGRYDHFEIFDSVNNSYIVLNKEINMGFLVETNGRKAISCNCFQEQNEIDFCTHMEALTLKRKLSRF